jgi:hypothetical protein
VRTLYERRIDELQTNIAIVLAAVEHDDAAFDAANESLYGRPDPDIFAASCAWLRHQAVQEKQKNPKLSAYCDQVLELVPVLSGSPALLAPNESTFEAVRKLHFEPQGYFEQLFKNSAIDQDIFTTFAGDPVTRQVIKNVGSDFTLEEASNNLWAVLQSWNAVMRPHEYELSRTAFYGIVAHEVGSHLLEFTNGSKSRLRLLALGLDHYELGNEGRAFLREQIMYAKFDDYVQQPGWYPTKASWEYRVAIHVAISLAIGLDGERWSFNKLFKLVLALFRFWTAKRGIPDDDDTLSSGAWSMVVRALKGTSGHGGAYYKDIVYLEGNIRCWKAAEQQPELILYGDLGKFDIANSDHVMMLEDIGVLPKHAQTKEVKL